MIGQHLNVRKSTGPDASLSGCFLKEVAVEIAEPIWRSYIDCINCQLPPFAAKFRTLTGSALI